MDYLNERDILRKAIKERSSKQITIAEQMGIPQNALSAKMTRERMSLDTFKEVLNVLGYDVVVVDRATGERMWAVGVEI